VTFRTVFWQAADSGVIGPKEVIQPAPEQQQDTLIAPAWHFCRRDPVCHHHSTSIEGECGQGDNPVFGAIIDNLIFKINDQGFGCFAGGSDNLFNLADFLTCLIEHIQIVSHIGIDAETRHRGAIVNFNHFTLGKGRNGNQTEKDGRKNPHFWHVSFMEKTERIAKMDRSRSNTPLDGLNPETQSVSQGQAVT
jgi:hypothetical protein